jgi:hypothetical protein
MPSFMSTAQAGVRTKNAYPHSIAPSVKPQYFVFIRSSFTVPLKNWMTITPDVCDCQGREKNEVGRVVMTNPLHLA